MIMKHRILSSLTVFIFLLFLAAGTTMAPDPFIVFSGPSTPGMSMLVSCYPRLKGQTVEIEDRYLAKDLVDALNGVTFFRKTDIKERIADKNSSSGGYSSSVTVLDKDGIVLYQVEENYGYPGILIQDEGGIYFSSDTDAMRIYQFIINTAVEQYDQEKESYLYLN